jgi:putative tryptophan/tyrosine transport system substrate-binding protein
MAMNPAHSKASRRRGGLRTTASAVAAAAVAAALAACSSAGSTGSAGAPGTASTSAAAAAAQPLRVGVFELVSATVIGQTVAAFEAELKAKVAPRPVTFDLKNAQGEAGLITSITRDFAESSDSAFAVIGTPAVVAMAQQIKSKPIFALAIGDPVGAKVAQSLDKPGGNVTGSIDYVDPAIVLKSVMEISPAPKRIGTIYDPSNENMQVWIKGLQAAAAKYPGLSVAESTISGVQDVPTAADSLAGRVDAELIGPDATVLSVLPAVGSTAAKASIPVYVIGGSPGGGILASIGPNYPTLGKLAADAAVKVFDGTPAADVPFATPPGVQIQVDPATMAKLHVTIPASLTGTAG